MAKKEEEKHEKLTDEQLEELLMVQSGRFSKESGDEANRIKEILKKRKENNEK